MILHRETENSIWVNSKPSAVTEVSLNDISAKVKAGENGRWKACLGVLKAGGPYMMRDTAEGRDYFYLQILVSHDHLQSQSFYN